LSKRIDQLQQQQQPPLMLAEIEKNTVLENDRNGSFKHGNKHPFA
jgi:hypothetical protein